MKAWKTLSMTLCLGGCIYAGEFNLLPTANVLAGLSGYHVDYLVTKDERLLDSEPFHETGFVANKLLTAYKGYSIANMRDYLKNYYIQEAIVAPTNAQMVSGVSPAEIVAGQKYEVIGHSKVKGKILYLVTSENPNDIFLTDENYELQPYLGRIRNDRLIILDNKYIVTPEGFKFEPITKSRVLQSDIVSGFEIKFEGVQNNIMRFTLMEYDAGGFTGEFKYYDFENIPGIIEIAGVKIKIFSASDARLEYMILVDEK